MSSAGIPKPVSDMIKSVCMRPAMYVGLADFHAAVSYMLGFINGFDERAGLHGSSTMGDFQFFLYKRYPGLESRNWMTIIPAAHEGQGLDNKELLLILKKELETYENVLERMATVI